MLDILIGPSGLSMACCSLVACLGVRLTKQFLKVILDVRNIVVVSNVKYVWEGKLHGQH